MLNFGDDKGHTIAFDDTGLLYHHGLNAGVLSRLSRVDLNVPGSSEILHDYATNVEWTAMTIQDDLFIVARRSSPSELWSIDQTGETYNETLLGPITSEDLLAKTVTGLAFACATEGDTNCDGIININEVDSFTSCVGGPDVVASQACALFDFDQDRDVDLHDWAKLQRVFTGDP